MPQQLLPVLAALGPVFALVLIGYLLGRVQFPHRDFWPQAERFTYFLLFPALLVLKLGSAQLPTADVAQIGVLLMALLLIGSALLLGLGRLFDLQGAQQTSLYQGGIRFNTYVGLGAASALFGEAGLIWGAVFVGIMIPLINVCCVSCFALLVPQAQHSVWTRVWRGIVTNPLILACALGLSLNFSGIGVPAMLSPVLALIGGMALPLGLLAVGVGLEPKMLRHGGRGLWLAALFKLAVFPMLFLLLARLLQIPAEAERVLLLFALLPTAPSAYILARQLGGDAPLMAAIITLQTLLAVVTMPLVLSVYGG